MPEYLVVIQETNTKHLLLEASSEDDAIERASNIDLIALSSDEEIEGVEIVFDEDDWEVVSANLANPTGIADLERK